MRFDLIAQYKVLDGIDPVEQAKFLALTKSLQPMVDKVLELLPLYLALSTQTEGARRLLVMVSPSPTWRKKRRLTVRCTDVYVSRSS
jgi:hypothetical protein